MPAWLRACTISMLILLCLPHGAYAQCPFAVSLHATGNCTGDTISIRTDFTLIQIVWFRNGVIDKTIINSPGDTLYNPAQAGSYSVIVSAENGCTMTIGPVVIAALDPTNSFPVSISSSTTSVCSGNPITFMVTTPSDASGLIYRWQMNNMPVAGSDQRYTVSGLSGGDVVSCLAINSSTCAAGTSNSIIMTADDCKDSILEPIRLPNAFTLNADGRNELFYVLHAVIFFSVFGTTPEMRQHYRTVFWFIPERLGYKRPRLSEVETVSDVAFNLNPGQQVGNRPTANR